MKNKEKVKNDVAAISNVELKHISTSAKGIGMYAITFNLGSKKIAQTRHMKPSEVANYTPTIEVVHSAGRTLQKSSFKVGA